MICGHRPKVGVVEGIMSFIVSANVVLVVLETDFRAVNGDSDIPNWMMHLNTGFLLVYTVELVVRINARRRAYFDDWGNRLDVVILLSEVLLGYVLVNVGIPSTLPLRVVRFFRLVRAAKAIRHFRELYVMTHGLASSFRAIFWATCLLFVSLLFSAIVAVEIIHPINLEVAADGEYADCSRCPRAFETVAASMLTFVAQILAGDSWSVLSVPIIEKKPATAILFLFVLLITNLWVLNLILSVIVDSAHEAREADIKQKLFEKEQSYMRAKKDLEKLCNEMDVSSDGSLCLDEVIRGYETKQDFRDLMNVLDAKKEDMPLIFAMMDSDKSGNITAAEFVEQLHKMKSQDLHTMLVFMRYHIQSLHDLVRERVGAMTNELQQLSSRQLVFAKDPSGIANGSLEDRAEQVSVKLLEDLSCQSGQHMIASNFPNLTHIAPNSIHVETSRLQNTLVDVPHEVCAEPVPIQETSPVMGRASAAFSVAENVRGAITKCSPEETGLDAVKRSSFAVLHPACDVERRSGNDVKISEHNGNVLSCHTQQVLSQASVWRLQADSVDGNKPHIQLRS
eukprot:TRINITY_DN12722_c0_g4_i1.p1 TRINITY_DN12722_c0_g4~~TRINITY_DN12722_c0_g4_i1.p1  ORF type:complete len:566 (+),score=67.61 TRINITY_DN12722_c0_g4_i1:77-1774(+)